MIAEERLVNYRTDLHAACGRDASPPLVLARGEHPSNRRANPAKFQARRDWPGQKSGRFECNLLEGASAAAGTCLITRRGNEARGVPTARVCKGMWTGCRTRAVTALRARHCIIVPAAFRRGGFRSSEFPGIRAVRAPRPGLLTFLPTNRQPLFKTDISNSSAVYPADLRRMSGQGDETAAAATTSR